MPGKQFVAYYRVSTQKQGESQLGMEAQCAAVESYVRQTGGTILGSFVEIESGKRSDRPELAKALEAAKRAKATLVIAKLDRLARNVAFIARLMDAGTEFVAVDQPHASRLTLHILSAFAEDEGRRISERTKAALAAAKRRGVRLGGWRGRVASDADRQRAAAAKTALAIARASELATTIKAIQSAGITTYCAIAARLNDMHVPTTSSNGGRWHRSQVRRVLARLAAIATPAQ
jgi:DNA invertase Pin-like site-specific DNA recombinase